jgi:hypothetical protein
VQAMTAVAAACGSCAPSRASTSTADASMATRPRDTISRSTGSWLAPPMTSSHCGPRSPRLGAVEADEAGDDWDRFERRRRRDRRRRLRVQVLLVHDQQRIARLERMYWVVA